MFYESKDADRLDVDIERVWRIIVVSIHLTYTPVSSPLWEFHTEPAGEELSHVFTWLIVAVRSPVCVMPIKLMQQKYSGGRQRSLLVLLLHFLIAQARL